MLGSLSRDRLDSNWDKPPTDGRAAIGRNSWQQDRLVQCGRTPQGAHHISRVSSGIGARPSHVSTGIRDSLSSWQSVQRVLRDCDQARTQHMPCLNCNSFHRRVSGRPLTLESPDALLHKERVKMIIVYYN
jgi:hypothetical protein